MNIVLRIFLFCCVFIYVLFIINLLRKNKLELKYALLWMLSGLFMIIVLVIPEFFLQLSSAIGIVEPVNMIFLLQGAFLLCICISLSVIVSGLNRKLRALIQDHALLEKRVRDLEKQMQEEK